MKLRHNKRLALSWATRRQEWRYLAERHTTVSTLTEPWICQRNLSGKNFRVANSAQLKQRQFPTRLFVACGVLLEWLRFPGNVRNPNGATEEQANMQRMWCSCKFLQRSTKVRLVDGPQQPLPVPFRNAHPPKKGHALVYSRRISSQHCYQPHHQVTRC